MRPTAKQLYIFMTSCGGNWRNTILIDSPNHPGDGILVAFDRNAHPVAFGLGKLRELCGEAIDPAECKARINASAAHDIFNLYLHSNASAEESPPEG